MKKVKASAIAMKFSSTAACGQEINLKSKRARTHSCSDAGAGTGLDRLARFSVAAIALLCVSCATQVGMESVAYEGGPASVLLEEHGDPDLRYVDDDGITYMAYRVALPTSRLDSDVNITNDRCSVIYTVREDIVLASNLVGFVCHEVRRIGRVNNLAAGLEGKNVLDVLMTFGSPDYGGLSDGTGTLFYDYGATSESAGGNVGNGASVAIGIGFGCALSIMIEGGRVTSTETEGGMCWATPI